MKAFNNKFYISGFLSLLVMGGVVIYTFRTLFGSLTMAFEVETQIPESELRINRQNLEKAYDYVYDSEPTKLDLEALESQGSLDKDGENEIESDEEEKSQ